MDQKRAPGRYLVPIKYEVNTDNGQRTWHVRVEEVDADGNVMQGPIVLEGIDTPALNRLHGGKHKNFLLNELKPKLMTHYEDMKQDDSEAQDLLHKSL